MEACFWNRGDPCTTLQVEVIGHEAKGVDLPAGVLAGSLERRKETLAVGVVQEDALLVVAAVHDVVNRARVSNAQFPSHGRSF
jgi:hypothetical protein